MESSGITVSIIETTQNLSSPKKLLRFSKKNLAKQLELQNRQAKVAKACLLHEESMIDRQRESFEVDQQEPILDFDPLPRATQRARWFD